MSGFRPTVRVRNERAGPAGAHYAEVDSRTSQSERPCGITGVVFTADGKTLPWRRDDVDLYEFHLTVPAGVPSIHAHPDSIATSFTNNVAVLEWERRPLLYPAGPTPAQILPRQRAQEGERPPLRSARGCLPRYTPEDTSRGDLTAPARGGPKGRKRCQRSGVHVFAGTAGESHGIAGAAAWAHRYWSTFDSYRQCRGLYPKRAGQCRLQPGWYLRLRAKNLRRRRLGV